MNYKEIKVIKFEDIPIEYQEEVYWLIESCDSPGNVIPLLNYIDLQKEQALFYSYLLFYNYLINNGFEENSTVIIERIKFIEK